MDQTAAFVGLYDTRSNRSMVDRIRRAGAWALVSIAMGVLTGCTSASMDNPRSGIPGTTGASATGSGVTGSGVTGSGVSGSGSTGAGGQGPGTGQSSDWCSVLSVLRANCQACHGAQPLYGAPMPLVTIENLHAHSVTTPSKYVYEMVEERIHDDQKPMPPPSTNTRLTAMEASTVDAWIAAGAPGGSDPSCSGSTTGATSTTSGATSGAGGGGVAGGGGTTTVGGEGGTMPPSTRPWPADCQQRYSFVAHGQSKPGDTTKFNVSTAPSNQFYQCFFFKAPWATDAVQSLAFRPIIDDARVVHHWILYGTDTTNGADGQVGGGGCSNGAMLAGWAPGGMGTDLPSDVGLQMPMGANATLALEIHYNNVANYKDALDASGVELCTTKAFRPNTAAVHWLGSNGILMLPHQTADVVSTCDPTSTQPVHVIGDSPHMHQLGVHAKLILNRKDGTHETLHDAPFAFADQRTYPLNVIVNDGDTLTTTCSYNNTTNGIVTFGPNTENEMCYNFVTAYPAGGLSGSGLGGSGVNHCLGP